MAKSSCSIKVPEQYQGLLPTLIRFAMASKGSKEAFAKQLKDLKEFYADDTVEDFVNTIYTVYSQKIDNFKRRNQGDWTKEDMFALFNERTVQVAEEPQNKIDDYLGETDLFDDKSEQFINNVYGTSTAKDILIKEIKNNLVNCLYINYDNASEVHTQEQINRNIIAYQEKLYQLILNNFKRQLKDFPHLTLYNEDGTNNLKKLNAILSDTKNEFNIAKLQYYSDGRLYANRLRALNALFTLNYFDRILLSQLPKKILINHSGGVLSDSLTKYSFNKNNENKNKSWRDDDKDINALDELSITTKEIIETLPVVDEDGNPIPGRTLKAGDIVSLNTFLRALAHHKNAHASLGYSIDKMPEEEISEEELFAGRMIRSKITNDGRKSLYDLVNDIVNDQANGLRNLYTLLSSKHFPYRNYNISKNQRQNILSLFHGVFSENNPKSLYNIYKSSLKTNYGIDEQPEFYYAYILQMLGSQEVLESQEYRRIKGKIENVTLKEQANTAQTYYIDNRIGGQFSVNLDKTFDNFEVNTNNLHHDKENIPSIDIIVTRNDGSKVTIRKTAKSEQLKAFVNNVEVPIDNNLFTQCTNFMKEVTGFDYSKDFIEVLETYQKEYAPMLFRFASNIIYNHSLSKKLYNTISDLDSYKDELKYYFVEENIPSVKESIKQISFTNDKDTNIKVALSKAYDELHHIDRTSTTKDAEGKQIGSNGLDQIATKPTTQWARSNKENPALANFSLNKLYRGQEFGRDFKGPSGTKKATAFTEAENFIASFMYDYLNEIYGEKGVVKILPSVISDKSRIPKTLFDLNQVSSFYNEEGLPKRYRDLTTEEWMSLTVQELGDYYKSIYDSTVNMWNDFSLALFELSVGDSDLNKAIRLVGNTLDYNTNFQNFNIRLSEAVASEAIPETYRYNKSKLLNDIIHYGIIQAQKKNPNFELTSIIHYTAKNGELKGNALLFDQLYRYGKLENPASYDAYGLSSGYGTFGEFIEAKKIQYVADLLKDDCEILLHDKYCNAFDDDSYKQIKKEGWSKGDNVVFGRITYNYMDNSGNTQTKTINITNKQDLRNNFIYRELNRLKGFPEYESVKDYININSPEFSFEKFIEAIQIYNATNYSPNVWLKRVHNAIKKATGLTDEQISQFVNEAYLNNIKDGKSFTISSKDLNIDSKELLTINSKIKSALTPIIGQIKATLNAEPVETNAIFEMNPFLEKYQITEYMLSSEYMNATVGTHINHPGKSNDLKQRESEAWGQQVKRNVSLTASKYKFALGLVDGIRSQYKVAVIEDDYDFVCNIYGKTDTAKPFDGATFNAITTNYLENKSLKGDQAGIDKKQFIHDYKAGSGTGIIVKTAGFPLTNGRLRDSLMLQRMNRKMLDLKFDSPVDITVDYNGNKLIAPRQSKYGDMTYIVGGKIYRTIDVVYASNPFEAIIVREQLTENGWELVKDSTPVVLDSNYQIWKQVFGGENSITIKSGDNTKNVNYEYSERSCEQLAFAMNKVGTKLNDEVLSQNDVDQVMKRSVIDYVITEGAIKQGAANVNSRNAYFDDDYELTTMTLNMYDAGIQLDAEHHADDSKLSLMTQVLNVLGARGYSSQEAEETYQALKGLTKDAIRQFDLGQIGIQNGDSSDMQEFLADIILRSIKTVGSTDGNLIAALSSTIISEYSKGNKVTYDLIRNNMPISNPATFNKMISSLASILTKRCVRIPFPGSLSVLSPSNRIYKLYRNHLLSHYNGDLSMLGYGTPFTDMGYIKLGRTYKFTYQDGSTEELLIDNPQDYWRIMDKQPMSIEENEKIGRDLATYGLTFTDGTNVYNMWDLDAVRDIWESKSDITQLQNVLNELHNGGTVSVRGGNIVTINNLNIEPYELIMTKVYETTFGLKKGDNVQDIVNNKLFFVERTLENLERKVDSKNYDVELKVLNGRHIYLVDSRGEIPGGLTRAEIDTRWDGDQLVQYDINNNKVRTLSSEKDSVYIDSKGNEIIVTDNINYYVNNTDFVQIGLSPNTDPNTMGQLLNTLANSNNTIVDAMLSNLMTDETIESVRKGEQVDLVAEELIKVLEKGQAQYDQDIEILKKNINTSLPEVVLKNIKSRVVKNLINKGLEIHTSFIKSLDVLAARIPAQSHQSFMAMKVVGFDDSGKNTAYVSRMQIYLQGSDFRSYFVDKMLYLPFIIVSNN